MIVWYLTLIGTDFVLRRRIYYVLLLRIRSPCRRIFYHCHRHLKLELPIHHQKKNLEVTYQAEDILPSDFVCGICKDVLVGACILDCNCCSSTVCMPCWKDADCDQQDFATRMDFVWIESKKCPSCHCNSEIKAYCHALDVAILHIIQDLPDSDVSVTCLKQKYYSRLSTWRETVSDRNVRYRREKYIRDDELLARLIQEEERVFWDETRSRTRKRSFFSSNKFRVFGQALLALIAAAGLKHMSRR